MGWEKNTHTHKLLCGLEYHTQGSADTCTSPQLLPTFDGYLVRWHGVVNLLIISVLTAALRF